MQTHGTSFGRRLGRERVPRLARLLRDQEAVLLKLRTEHRQAVALLEWRARRGLRQEKVEPRVRSEVEVLRSRRHAALE